MVYRAFEWDEAKRRSNFAKHGVDFLDAIRVFEDPARIERIDDQIAYSEERLQIIGRVEDQVLFIACTERIDIYRMISARKANRREEEAYYSHQG